MVLEFYYNIKVARKRLGWVNNVVIQYKSITWLHLLE